MVMSMPAALLELLALRTKQPPPGGTAAVGAADRPLYLLKSAGRMKRLQALCSGSKATASALFGL
jgi:hypothetical protein